MAEINYTMLTKDSRPICQITINADYQNCHTVGRYGVTRIVPFDENGEMAHVPGSENKEMRERINILACNTQDEGVLIDTLRDQLAAAKKWQMGCRGTRGGGMPGRCRIRGAHPMAGQATRRGPTRAGRVASGSMEIGDYVREGNQPYIGIGRDGPSVGILEA